MGPNEVAVKLTGDSKDLQRELDKSADSIGGWGNTIKAAVAGIAALFVIDKIVDFGKALVSSADEEARAWMKLETVMKNTGEAAGFTKEQFSVLAANAQKFHGIADDVYVSTAAVLSAFDNLRGVNFDRTIKSAADIAEIMGGDVASSAEMLGKAMNNPVRGMMMLRRQGVLFTEEQKALVEQMVSSGDVMGAQTYLLDALESKFGGASANAVKTFGGRIEQLNMSIGDMGEAIGGYMIPFLEAMMPPIELSVKWIGNLVLALTASSDETKQWSENWGAYFVDTLKWSMGIATDVFSFFEFLWTNFTKIGEREGLSWTLTITSFVEDMKHMFTEVAPAYLDWFFNNWSNLIVDFANFHKTVSDNMWKNLSNFFTGVIGWLSGEGGSFEWTALTDGFEATTAKLPEIAERNLSDFEKMLKKDIERIDDEMGKSWNDIFDSNKKLSDSLFEDQDQIDLTPKIDTKPYKIFSDENDKAKDSISKVKDDLSKVDGTIVVDTKLGENVGLTDLGKSIADGNKEAQKSAEELAKKQKEVAGMPFVFEGNDRVKQANKPGMQDKDGIQQADGNKEAQKSAEELAKKQKEVAGMPFVFEGNDRAKQANKPGMQDKDGIQQVGGISTKGRGIEDLIKLLEVQHPELLTTIRTAGGLA